MQNAQTLVAQYLEAFNEADADRRRELVEAFYTPDRTYTDPHVDLEGAEQIDGFIEQTQERFPGSTFTLRDARAIRRPAGWPSSWPGKHVLRSYRADDTMNYEHNTVRSPSRGHGRDGRCGPRATAPHQSSFQHTHSV
jgi:hypothetical protein